MLISRVALRFLWGAGLSLLVIMLSASPLAASDVSQPRPLKPFIAELQAKARAEGISQELLDKVFANFRVDHKAVKADKNQAEDKLRFTRYKNNIVSDYRVRRGRELYRKHRDLLDDVAARYNVPAKYIVALWGTETAYGKIMGGHNVPRALATLAYEGRREAFFTREFLLALKIIEDGHIRFDEMQGSWAGAMGQTQFMPSSFLDYAVDYDLDGDKDIWNSLPDVFASIANYLQANGWQGDERWGRKVRLPEDFDLSQEDINGFYPLGHWRAQGVTFADGRPLPNVELDAAFMLPGEPEEGAYLVYPNFHVLLKWNFSRLFATAVGTLADRIATGM